jgi:PadR family transcriptional regulator, regulatory protein PadR
VLATTRDFRHSEIALVRDWQFRRINHNYIPAVRFEIPVFAIGISGIPLEFNMAKKPEHRDHFSGALELMILHSLRLKPMHGYALVKHIRRVSEDLLKIEEGSLYPALQRMLRERSLQCEVGISAKGRPARIYKLTRAGRRHLAEEISSFERMFSGITRVLAIAKV